MGDFVWGVLSRGFCPRTIPHWVVIGNNTTDPQAMYLLVDNSLN